MINEPCYIRFMNEPKTHTPRSNHRPYQVLIKLWRFVTTPGTCTLCYRLRVLAILSVGYMLQPYVTHTTFFVVITICATTSVFLFYRYYIAALFFMALSLLARE